MNQDLTPPLPPLGRRERALDRKVVLLAIAATLVASSSSPAAAQGVEGLRGISVALGTGLGLSGNVIEEGVGQIGSTPAIFVEQAWGNHYSDGMRLRFIGTYGFDYDKEAFVTFAYGRLNGTERITGSVGGYPLHTRFETARTIDLEAGVRYYLQPEGPVRTYVAGTGGLRFMQAIESTLRVVELGLTFNEIEYFENSTLFIFGGDAGVSYDVSDQVAIGAELGLRFQPKPGQADILQGTGLEDINDTGSRWSLPLSAFLTWRF
jgi:opacity protein-like surface antigen